ncbi:hypothetical protein RND81_13G099000 [Saponaria officinalis]|uniref:Uncharacterized protein n=1 Tax=Saponaria officinalis TaxID=3572 RepID=A0AAW1H5H7_SAPOF
MLLGRNPGSLILGETVVGLDDRRVNPVHEYRGSPRILKLWLMDRLQVLAHVPFSETFVPGGVTRRSLDLMVPSERPADYFTGFVREHVIKWVVPWWGLTSMTATTPLQAARSLKTCSLDLGLRIYPFSLMREYGGEQRIPERDTEIVEPEVLNNGMVEEWSRRWADRATWTVLSPPATTRVTDVYHKWTVAKEVQD